MQIFPALDIGLRDVVNFSLFENTTIGTTFTRVRLVGVVDYSTAVQKIDPVALHEDIITNLPEGSIDDPTAYSYLKIALENGDHTFVGLPWVDTTTLQKVGSNRLVLSLDNVNPDDVPNILAALTANGYTVSSSTIE